MSGPESQPTNKMSKPETNPTAIAGSSPVPCSPSSLTPETDKFKKVWPDNRRHNWPCSFEADAFAKMESLERDRDYWKNKRTMELESLMPIHHHEWSDGARVKIPGKEWRLECCPCGATRQKSGSLILSENVNVEARDQ